MMNDVVLKEGFVKRVGLITATPIFFNPTRAQIAKLMGKDEEDVKEPNYISEGQDGEKKVRIDIWQQEAGGARSKIKIYLTDKVQQSKTNKFKFIDKKGNLSYFLEDESKLPKFMQANSPWASRLGEYELYRFLQAYMIEVDRRKTDNMSLDWKKLINGNVKELNDLIGKPFTNDVISLLYVKAEKKEGEIAEYQEVYNRNFLPAKFMKYFKVKGEVKNTKLNEFVNEITGKEYGLKHFYGGILGEARPYKQDENPIIERLMTDSPFAEDEDDDSADYN